MAEDPDYKELLQRLNEFQIDYLTLPATAKEAITIPTNDRPIALFRPQHSHVRFAGLRTLTLFLNLPGSRWSMCALASRE